MFGLEDPTVVPTPTPTLTPTLTPTPTPFDADPTLKGVFMAVLFVLAILGGLVPWKARNFDREGHYLSFGNVFSAGVFIGGGLLHLLPESDEHLKEEGVPWGEFPMAYFLCGVGFFIVLFVEECVLAYQKRLVEAEAIIIEEHPELLDAIVHDEYTSSGQSTPLLRALSNKGVIPPPMNVYQQSQTQSHSPRSQRPSIEYVNDSDELHGKLLSAANVTQGSRPHYLDNPDMLKLYLSRRRVAHSIVSGLVTRASVLDSRQSMSDYDFATLPPTQYGYRQGSFVPPPPSVDPDIRAHPSMKAKEQAYHPESTLPPTILEDVSKDAGKGHGHAHGGDDHSHGGEIEKSSSKSKHGHSDDDDDEENHDHLSVPVGAGNVTAIILVLALSFHGVFEGMALGTATTQQELISIFIAIASHMPLGAFALGVSLAMSGSSFSFYLVLIVTFSVMNPIGAGIGMYVSSIHMSSYNLNLTSGIFQSLASGTFLFVAMQEIIPKEMSHNARYKFFKIFVMISGFIFMALVKYFLDK